MGLGTLVVLATLASAPQPRPNPYTDHLLVEVEVPDAATLTRLLETGVDPWPEHPRVGAVPVLVSPERRAMLWAGGWQLRVLPVDVQAELDAEADRLASATPVVPGGGDFFADFRDLATIDAEVDAIAAAAPELVTVFDLGESIEGRAIRAVRITAAGDDGRPAVLVTVGQHAREWIAVSSGMYVIDQLVTRATEPEIAEMLAAVQVFVVPVVNPDGYEHSWVGDRYWRKNRRDGIGVDTNRNFGHNWGGLGASAEPEDGNYAGTAAFSEPESAAVRDFVQAHPELVAHLDLHSFGQLVLYPWGDVFEPAPDDAALSATANAMADAMDAGGAGYTAIQGVDLYPAAGNAIDWSYGDAGLHAVTMELRPTDEEIGFVLPPGEIVPVGDEVFAGLWVLLAWANGDVPEPPDPTTGDPTMGGSSSSGGSDGTAGSSDGASSAASGADGTGGQTGGVDADASSDGDGDGSSGGGASAQGEGTGCGCATTRAPPWGWWLLAFGVIGRARPRSVKPSASR